MKKRKKSIGIMKIKRRLVLYKSLNHMRSTYTCINIYIETRARIGFVVYINKKKTSIKITTHKSRENYFFMNKQ